jgi:hypothetical protein
MTRSVNRRISSLITSTKNKNKKTDDIILFKTAYELLMEYKQKQHHTLQQHKHQSHSEQQVED